MVKCQKHSHFRRPKERDRAAPRQTELGNNSWRETETAVKTCIDDCLDLLILAGRTTHPNPNDSFTAFGDNAGNHIVGIVTRNRSDARNESRSALARFWRLENEPKGGPKPRVHRRQPRMLRSQCRSQRTFLRFLLPKWNEGHSRKLRRRGEQTLLYCNVALTLHRENQLSIADFKYTSALTKLLTRPGG